MYIQSYVRIEDCANGEFILNTEHVSEIHVPSRFVRMSNGHRYSLTKESFERLLQVLGIEVE